MHLSTPPPEESPSPSSFDITQTYTHLLRTDPSLTMPLAAIQSLLLLLSHTPPSTISETLSLLSHHSQILSSSIPNPISLSAGTDLFQRYIVSTLSGGKEGGGGGEDFQKMRERLLGSGRLFTERGKEAREAIAGIEKAGGFVREGCTVGTCGGSRVVSKVLEGAAGRGVRFRVVYVRDSRTVNGEEGDEHGMVKRLRGKGIPVAVIQPEAMAYSLREVTMMMVGAEGVVENGGVISRLGTYQLAMLARSAGKPFYVVAESHKFVRLYPLGQYDLPIKQMVVDFKDAEGVEIGGKGGGDDEEEQEAVDYTPPELITALVTEVGVHTPSAVSEELIKIWY
ncbi:MAG: hypothetical protein Q9184_001243 [Pyrenodesmia sp. 2 TL-2023]